MTDKPQVEHKKISDFTPDNANANRGTERGLRMLDDSLSLTGAGRSIVVDKHGHIIAGNKTTERAVDNGFEDAIVVHTTGDKLVVVQRDDLDLYTNDPENKARLMAYYDNRTSELSLDWSAEQLLADNQLGVPLDKFFSGGELEYHFSQVDSDGTGDGTGSDGSLLSLLDITIDEPKHTVVNGDIWNVGKHTLICCEVITDWLIWKPHLTGADTLFCPYPGVFTPLSKRAAQYTLIMVQPDTYICGHILDRYADVNGARSVSKR